MRMAVDKAGDDITYAVVHMLSLRRDVQSRDTNRLVRQSQSIPMEYSFPS